MAPTIAAATAAILLMAQLGKIEIEPGQQRPQSVVVQAGDKDAPRDVTIRYLLFVPQDYKTDGPPKPLLLFLHGLGESSDDDLNLVKVHGPAKIVEGRPDFPFIVVTPQCPPPPGYDPKQPGRLLPPE